MAQNGGFFTKLFDFSFSEFITTQLIKLLYGVAIVFAGLFVLASIASGFQASAIVGPLVLIVSPLLFVLYVIIARVYCELIIVLFRIAENTRDTAEALRR